jgi:threonine/homoserine/homoserine lactone efflux protein
MALTAIATYAVPPGAVWPAFLEALVFGIVNIPSVSAWALFGTAMRRFLNNPSTLRIFNITMAVLLLLSLWPLLRQA